MIKSLLEKGKKSEMSDRDLFLQMSKGEYKALDILFKRHYMSLCRFGQLYEDNFSIIEEKISDVFMMLWDNRSKLDQIINPKPYLYVIARNSLKKGRKLKTRLQYLDDKEIKSSIQYAPSKEDQVIDQEQQEKRKETLMRVLDDMPVQSRRIFEMSRVDGLTYKEISEIIEITPKTVENHMAIALKYFSRKIRVLKL